MDAIDYVHEQATWNDSSERLAYQLFHISAEFLNFRANLQIDDDTEDPDLIVQKCQHLDERFAIWYDDAANYDGSWKFEVIFDADANYNEVWAGVYHAYSTYVTSMAWFFYRFVRGLLLFTYDHYLRKSSLTNVAEEKLRLAELRAELLEDICAGIPWRLGYGQEGVTHACG